MICIDKGSRNFRLPLLILFRELTGLQFLQWQIHLQDFFIFSYFCLMRLVDILTDLLREEKIKRSLREPSLLASYRVKSCSAKTFLSRNNKIVR